MTTIRAITCVLIFALGLIAAPANAWGPDGQVAIVSAATHLLGQDSAFNLRQFLKYVAAGASQTDDELAKMFPAFSIDAVGTIQREMVLLQTVRSDRIDPYYAYRLGALGAIVARATAPLATSDAAAIRAQYYTDVDSAINTVNLRPDQRKVVDPRAYFSRVRSEAATNDQTILVDYRGGAGFRGFARSSLPYDASRSVNAVADVWYTILTAQLSVYDQPVSARREYVLSAVDYYLKSGNLEEVRAAYDYAIKARMMDNDMRKEIGDRYFSAGLYEHAMQEYQTILETAPDRRDVVERVAEYYEQAGDTAVSMGDLEDAREAYAKSVEANSLRTDAQRKLLEVESSIAERDRRMLVQQTATDEAREFENRAEESVVRRDFARAISLLREAEARYATVTDEFPEEAKIASLGLRNVSLRLKEVKNQLMENSQSLSGTGYLSDVRRLASDTPDNSAQALKGMVQNEFRGATSALGSQNPVP